MHSKCPGLALRKQPAMSANGAAAEKRQPVDGDVGPKKAEPELTYSWWPQLTAELKKAYLAAFKNVQLASYKETEPQLVQTEAQKNELTTSLEEELNEGFADPDSRFLIAFMGKEPVGFIAIYDRKDYISIRQLVVLPEYQHQNVGKALLGLVQLRYPDRPYYGIARISNQRARKFYAEFMKAEEGAVFLEKEHPKLKKEDGWVGLSVGKIMLRKTAICVVLHGDEQEGSSVGIAKDIETLDNFWRQYPDVSFVTIRAADISLADLQYYMTELRAQQLQKLFLFYTGHSQNVADSEYPGVLFKDAFVSIERDIFEYVKSRFELAIVGSDCCNSLPARSEDEARPQETHRPPRVHPFSASGSLLFTSSSKGEPSYGSASAGGRFTRTFFNLFMGYWIDALTRTKQRLALHQAKQTPRWSRESDLIEDMARPVGPAPLSPNLSFVKQRR